MLGLSRWRQWFSLALVGLGFMLSLPALVGPEKARCYFPSFLADQVLSFGLDLRGGVHLLLEVDQEKLFADYYSLLLSNLRKQLRGKKVRYIQLKAGRSGIRFQLLKEGDAPLVEESVKQLDPELEFSVQDKSVRLFLTQEGEKKLLEGAQKKSIETIRKRVDETGTKEPLIQAQGDSRIVLQMPGADDPERVKRLVGQTARLTFQMVRHIISEDEAMSRVMRADEELLWPFKKRGSSNTSEALEKKGDFAYVVEHEVILSGDMLVDAQPSFDEYNRVQVAFAFNSLGGELFGEATRKHTGHLFAIVLDGQVISAPQIKEPILGGRGVIQGSFSVEEASELSLLMRSGALPAPLNTLEERVIGPGLGVDSIRLGTTATLWSVFVVMGIMFLAYAAFGVFANISLLLNLIFLMGSMAFLGATLTLPGIAGIALTLGMAVDANVLINERIREELLMGRRLIPAIDYGYQRAMTTIIDSNLTTLIGAFILYIVGTGPVRGFAVTLSLGILISMLTAVSLSKVFVALWLRLFKPQTLKF